MRITSPNDVSLQELCEQLRNLAPGLDEPQAWPKEQLRLCAEYGVYEWFLAPDLGGQGWSETDIIRGYLKLSAACLTTTFVITQRMGACRRIAASGNQAMIDRWLPGLIAGDHHATVGISHLTTSRRHLSQHVMQVVELDAGFCFEGFSPWITGALHADVVVIGGTLNDGRQVLAALPTDCPGVSVPAATELVGLSASQTGSMNCSNVLVEREWLLAGPVENVMNQGVGAKTGGLQTSTLAVGLADAATSWLLNEAEKREGLLPAAKALRDDWHQVHDDLMAMAEGKQVCTNEEIRTHANSLALRSAQAALAAAKGTGYVLGHPAGRWCREALFFLVWSCPQPVMEAQLCELAGLE